LDEHVRFAAYLDRLGHVADRDETDLVSRVLAEQSPSAPAAHRDAT
jgi:hypothetical protein